MKIEHRSVHAEVRTSDDDPGVFEAVVMNYGQVDTYNTTFDAGCFRESLEERMPRITWGHDWKDVIGQYVDFKDTNSDLTLIGKLDDFDAVPRAKQAHAQLKSGTIDQFSVGFTRKPGGVRMVEEREHFTRCGLDEAALVLSGSVPNTKLVSVRSAVPGGLTIVRQVPVEFVVDLGKKIAAGELTHDEAEAALALASGTTPPVEEPPAVDTEAAEAIVEADAALADFLG